MQTKTKLTLSNSLGPKDAQDTQQSVQDTAVINTDGSLDDFKMSLPNDSPFKDS